MSMPKKIRRHLLKFIGVFAIYYEIMVRLEAAHLLMNLVTPKDPYKIIGYVVTGIFLMIFSWFVWRFYTGVLRDGDFWD